MDSATREAVKKNFDAAGNNPGVWLWTAETLRFTAKLVEPHFVAGLGPHAPLAMVAPSAKVQGPILMLRGCELECLFKALYVAHGGKLAASGQYKPPKGKPHDLLALAR